MREVLPMPASPATSTTQPLCPAAASSHSARSARCRSRSSSSIVLFMCCGYWVGLYLMGVEWTIFDRSGRMVHHSVMPETASPPLLETPESEEAFLQTLLNRISPTPNAALVLKVALKYASAHPKKLSPELLLTSLRTRGEQMAPDWVKNLGPTLGAQDAMNLTGLSKSGLHKAKDEDRIFALRLPGENFDRFPFFQFA